MNFTSIGDLAGSFHLRNLNGQLRRRAETLGAELSSGRAADVAAKLGGSTDRLAMVTRSVAILGTLQNNVSEVQTKASGLQSALGIMQTAAKAASVQFLAAAAPASDTAIKAAGATAEEALTTAVNSMNTQWAGRNLFSGQAFDAPAVISAPDMLTDLQTFTAGATTAAQVLTIVDTYFNDPSGGFETSAYRGSAQATGPVRISESDTAELSVTALDPAVRATLKGFALGALVSRGVLAADLSERSALMKSAGEATLTANDLIVGLQADIGAVESRVETVQIGNVATLSRLEVSVNDMTKVDTYRTATALRATENSLEALYVSTSRLAQLSLVRYLR